MSVSVAGEIDLVPPWPGEFVAAAGTSLYVRRAPATRSGVQPAVFLHGLGGGSTSWTDLMELTRDRLDGYAPDLPGFGHSPPPPDGDYDVDAQVRATVGLIESGRYGAVHLFGNSLGGSVAIGVAERRPDLVRTLTLVSPALPELRPRLASVQLLVPLVPGVGPALIRCSAARGAEALARENLEFLYGDPSRIHPQRLREITEEIRSMEGRPHMRAAYLGALRGLVGSYLRRGPRSLWRQASRVQAPVLAIYGERDPFVSPRTAARALRAFHRSRVVMLTGVGHVAHMETPEVIADAVSALLPDLPHQTDGSP